MARAALQILVTIVFLLAPMTVIAQRDVVISVSLSGTTAYPYHIGFTILLFTKFHDCLSKGADSCVVGYELLKCPDCTADTVIPSLTNNQESNTFYKCTIDQAQLSLNCKRQTKVSPTPNIPPTTYLLRNSSYPSKCFGFVWTFNTEGISFNNDQWNEEFCGDNCACPSRSTTPQLVTSTKSSSPLPTVFSPSMLVTSSPSRSSSPSATTQKPLQTEIPTNLTTVVLTANTGSPSTESSSGTANSDDDPPIGVIVGAALGVMAMIVIIIIIALIWRRRRAKSKSSDHDNHLTSTTSSNGAGVNDKTNDRTSHSYHNSVFSGTSSGSHASKDGVIKINGYQNSLHQPNITKNGGTPVKHPPKTQFAIKDNDSDFGYSKAQLVVPEDNNNVNGKKSRDDYDYVPAENDFGVSDPKPKSTESKSPDVIASKVKYDYPVVDKTRQNKNLDNNIVTNKGLTSDYDDIAEEYYGYSHAEGDASAQGTNDASMGKAHVTVPNGNLPGTSDLNQDFGYEYSRASDGYTTVGNVTQSDLDNDDPNATNVYSRLHQEVRDIKNPYNVGPNTNDVYSKLHEEVRDIQNPYSVLPEPQGASDSSNALTDTANSADDTKEQKPSKSLPYGEEDYAVVVKTKPNKPTQSTFELGTDKN